MKELLTNLSRRISLVFKEKSNIIILLLLCNIALMVYIYLEIQDKQFHFYMNTKSSLEHIQNTLTGSKNFKFDVYDGKPSRELSTEEQLIRKNNRRFHLYYFFKGFSN